MCWSWQSPCTSFGSRGSDRSELPWPLNRGSSQGPWSGMDAWPELTIGEVARRAGVATSAIRYYERVGLLPPAERVSGQRRYGEETLGRLAFIGVAQNAGFSLREIRELVARAAEEDDLATPMRALSERKLP